MDVTTAHVDSAIPGGEGKKRTSKALGPTSADPLPIHQVKQGCVNRRLKKCHLKYTNDKNAIRTITHTTLQKTSMGPIYYYGALCRGTI